MEWIDINEKTPEFDKEVICWVTNENNSYIMLGYFESYTKNSNGITYCFSDNEDNYLPIVSHWMDLPEKPKK